MSVLHGLCLESAVVGTRSELVIPVIYYSVLCTSKAALNGMFSSPLHLRCQTSDELFLHRFANASKLLAIGQHAIGTLAAFACEDGA